MLNLVVIEDNPDLNDLLVENLSEQPFRVSGFADVGQYEASGVAGDLFLLDLNLPQEDGLSFAARLKQDRPEVGVVVLSARAGSEARTQTYLTGADTFLQKPCEMAEIIAALTSAAQRVRRFAALRAPSDAGLTIARRTMRLRGAGAEVQLSHDETAMVCALAEAPEQRLTYEELLALLDPLGRLTLATLEVRITRLRQKARPVTRDGKFIRSIRNTGYALVEECRVAD